MNRYAGKPMLRLLECYVLHSISKLSASEAENLRKIEPKLSTTFNATGTWYEIVAKQMNFPAELPGKIVEIWEAYSKHSLYLNKDPDATQFAMQFVDENFS